MADKKKKKGKHHSSGRTLGMPRFWPLYYRPTPPPPHEPEPDPKDPNEPNEPPEPPAPPAPPA